jgi:molybdate transport system permease protein
VPGPVGGDDSGAATARRGAAAAAAVMGICASALVLLVAVPLVALVLTTSPRALLEGLGDPMVGPAFRLTLFTTTTSLALVVACGTPLAWLVARRPSRLARAVETVLELPVVLPPAVAGVALLLAFGRRGLLGGALAAAGVSLPFSRAAVVLAETFVAAPFYVQAAVSAFRQLDPEMVLVARTLGASGPRVFLTIGIPTARAALVGGAAMSWARALGEFGATLMFAGNMAGRTQTLPLAIYAAMESDVRTAQSLSLVLVAAAFGLLVALRAGARRP